LPLLKFQPSYEITDRMPILVV